MATPPVRGGRPLPTPLRHACWGGGDRTPRPAQRLSYPPATGGFGNGGDRSGTGKGPVWGPRSLVLCASAHGISRLSRWRGRRGPPGIPPDRRRRICYPAGRRRNSRRPVAGPRATSSRRPPPGSRALDQPTRRDDRHGTIAARLSVKSRFSLPVLDPGLAKSARADLTCVAGAARCP